MDNATNDLLRDIAALQKEQNDLLKRYLWRLRFSLLSLLLMTTLVAVTLGVFAVKYRAVITPPPATPAPRMQPFPYRVSPPRIILPESTVKPPVG